MFDRRTFLKFLGLGFLAPTLLAKLAPAAAPLEEWKVGDTVRACGFDLFPFQEELLEQHGLEAGYADRIFIVDPEHISLWRMTGGIEDHVWVREPFGVMRHVKTGRLFRE